MKSGLTRYSVITAAVFAVLPAAPAHADFVLNGNYVGNVAATSTYVWRGLAQTSGAALQGGANYSDPSGIHTGVWTSNVDGDGVWASNAGGGGVSGSELDLMGGYSGRAGTINYDAGIVVYRYSQYDSSASFEEVYAGIIQGALSAKISTSSKRGTYFEVGALLPVNQWNMALHFGSYSRDNLEDYIDYSITLSRQLTGFKVGFMLSDTDLDGADEDFRTVVSVSKDFIP